MAESKPKPPSGDIFADLTNMARTRAWTPSQAAPLIRPTPTPATKQVVYGMTLDVAGSIFTG